uniref:Uncharacterized protein n=1 Tax=Arundo donax TaxID=35708 RepID=A0A0A9C3M5_ARUDO
MHFVKTPPAPFQKRTSLTNVNILALRETLYDAAVSLGYS